MSPVSAIFLSLFFWVGASLQVGAAPILVRSGEHADFTRLVLRLSEGVQWSSETSGNSVKITFQGVADGFETGRVFDVIPRSRISDISSTADTIEIVLGCACGTKAFLEAGSYLVIDVSETLPRPTASQVVETPEQAPVASFGYGDLIWSDIHATLPAEPPSSNPVEHANHPLPNDWAAGLDAIRPRLMDAIGNAASRGILRAATDAPVAQQPSESMPENADEQTSKAEANVRAEAPARVESHIKVSNSSELASPEAPSNLSLSGNSCPEGPALDLSEMEADSDFSASLGYLRMQLFDAADRLDQQAAHDLAIFFLQNGFGAEAREILAMTPELFGKSRGMLGIADLLEQKTEFDGSVFEGHAGCDSDWALWSFLASDGTGGRRAINHTAILRTLAGYPDGLRRAIARQVSDRFLDIGNLEAATLALRTTQKAIFETPGDSLTGVRILTAERGETQAGPLLNELATSNVRESPIALAELVRRRFEAEQTLEPDLALLADTYAFEHRDSELGSELRQTQVLASALSDQFQKAFDEIDDLQSEISADASEELNSKVLSVLLRHPDDILFLEFALAKKHLDRVNGNELLRERIAERLQSLGFPEQVQRRQSAPNGSGNGARISLLEPQDLAGAVDTGRQPTISDPSPDQVDREPPSRRELPSPAVLSENGGLQVDADRALEIEIEATGDLGNAALAALSGLAKRELRPEGAETKTIAAINTLVSESETDRLEITTILNGLTIP